MLYDITTLQNIASLIAAAVGTVTIVTVLKKIVIWYRRAPIRSYIENTALNIIAEKKLISIYNQLNENDESMLLQYKQNQDNGVKSYEYDNKSHIKLKSLGLINEVINNQESQARIKSLVESGFSIQWNSQKIKDDQIIKDMYEQQIKQFPINNNEQINTEEIAAQRKSQLDQINIQLNTTGNHLLHDIKILM